MVNKASKLSSSAFVDFQKKNPDFDILTFDFHDKEQLEIFKEKLSPKVKFRSGSAKMARTAVTASAPDPDLQADVDEFKKLQRIARITPSVEVAEKLIQEGFDSSKKISLLTQQKFVRLFSDVIGSEEKAKQVYVSAVHVTEIANHLYGNVKDVIASPLYAATAVKIVDNDMENYYKTIPSYQALFGSLDYLNCDDCYSIFSPSAYFLDIMRIVDDYISDPNIDPVRTIPEKYTLEERRPDLFEMKLNCENTNTVISYLQLVNEILVRHIEKNHGVTDAYKDIAVNQYPFTTPYNQPLSEIRAYLNQLNQSLFSVLQSIGDTDPAAKVSVFDVARENIGLSLQQFKFVSNEDFTDDGLTASYGYNIEYQPATYTGSGSIMYLKDQNDVTGVGTLFTSEIKVNDQIVVGGIAKKVIKIDSDRKLSVESKWEDTAGKEYIVVAVDKPTVNGTGTVATQLESPIIKGAGTKFLKEVKTGDILSFADMTIIVVSVESDEALTVSQNLPFFATKLDFTITSKAISPYKGAGIAMLVSGSATVTGMGTRFTEDFKAGVTIKVNDIVKSITAVISDTELTTDSTWNVTTGNTFLVSPQRTIKKLSGYLPRKGTGTVVFNIDSVVLKGKGTKFKNEVAIGDQIRCADTTRTVKSINSDTELEVLDNWTMFASDADFDILPVQGLDIVDNFVLRTNLKRPEQEDLFTQNLSNKELAGGVAESLFINNTNEGVPYIRTYFTNDPSNPIQRIRGLTMKRLDRLNRFIRFSRITDWSFADLNWLFVTFNSAGFSKLSEELIIYLSEVRSAQLRMPNVTIPELTSFWYEMKTIGKGSDSSPIDLFDQVFNNPLVLKGKEAYAIGGLFNPYSSPPVQWEINGKAAFDGVIQERLSTALKIGIDDVIALGSYVYALKGGVKGKLELNISNLSWMYRLNSWKNQLEMTFDGFFNFLCLNFYKSAPYLSPPANSILPVPKTIWNLMDNNSKLDNTGLDSYSLNYIIKGETGMFYELPYDLNSMQSFVDEIALAANASRFDAKSLIFEDIDSEKANVIYCKMSGTIFSSSGIFLKYGFEFNDAAPYYPIIKVGNDWQMTFRKQTFSLFFPDITEAESEAVFKALTTSTPQILILNGTDEARLSADYKQDSDLSYLEANFKKEEAKRKTAEIGSLLSQCKSDIDHTIKAWTDSEKTQQNIFRTRLAVYIDTTETIVKSLKDYVAKKSGLADYLSKFLTGIPVSEAMKNFISTLSRLAVLTDHLSMDGAEVLYLTSDKGPAHFNISELSSLTVDNVMSLISYNQFVKDFGIKNDELITYFMLPKDTDCPKEKINKLSSLTGWKADQVCLLNNLFWPSGTAITDYDTIAGLIRLQRCFNIATAIGGDIASLISFSTISSLDINPNNTFNEANWSIFKNMVVKINSLAGSKFNDTGFAEVVSAVEDVINTASRNALLPYAIWRINATNPSILSPSNLYNYLLIDVETSGLTTTSRISQGISSVQLYMQRCRMMLESGVNVIDIPKIWWDWMSSYRIWEVNRKIFLYPENYIEPGLRKNITPEYKQFKDNILQNDINKKNVQEPFKKYIQAIDLLGSLVNIASYRTKRKDALTGEEKETLFLFGRTNIQPYTYYMRKLDDGQEWGSWLKIDIAINAINITPVYAYDRIFVFWSEKSITQSSSVTDTNSSTETIEIVDLKYSFYDESKWVHPQVLYSKKPINAFPISYDALKDDLIQNLLNDKNSFWNAPYVISSGKGIAGAGTVEVPAGLMVVTGKGTQFIREAQEGDTIWCLGEKRIIGGIVNDTTLIVTEPWSNGSSNSEYKIVSRSGSVNTSAFIGEGTVVVTKTLQVVDGDKTKFLDQFTYGDNIVVGDETRMVIYIKSNTQLFVDEKWGISATNAQYTISPRSDEEEQLIVLFGANLPISSIVKVDNFTPETNPNKNSFIADRNEFNQSIYDSMKVGEYMKDISLKGDITLGPIQIINSNLLQTKTNLAITEFNYSAVNNPQPYGAALSRQQSTLVVTPNNSPILNNYWGNNIPGSLNTDQFVDFTNAKRLLYYTNKDKSSLINVGNQPGWFVYNNSDEAFLVQAYQQNLNMLSDIVLVRPYPILPEMLNSKVISTQAISVKPTPFNDLKFKFTRLTTNVTPLLLQKLFAGGIDNLLTLRSQEIPELPFSRFYPAPGNAPAPSVIPPDSTAMDFDGAFGIYFWEIFFHAPFFIADKLNESKRFEDAKAWIEYIFNPTVNEDDSTGPDPEKRFWRFHPFRKMTNEDLTATLTNQSQIRRYNYDPFNPDIIAKYRPVAYAKAIVMKYVDNILDWGDLLFRQDSAESINQATNLYILANDLLGKRPESQGKMPTPKPANFNEIKAKYSRDIPQFLIDLENTPPVYSGNDASAMINKIPFNKSNDYFCVPENTDFMAYWDKIEDRLFKIRHSQNFDGVFRKLALFSPPIDPRAFIRAYSSGSGGFDLISSFNSPIPYYKFNYLLDKAKNLTAQVGSLGNALLSALEKRDSEALNLIRLKQESTVLQLTTAIKEFQIQALKEQNASQQESLKNAQNRFTHYKDLISDGISNREQVSMDAALAAMVLNTIGAVTKTAASIGYAVPQVGSPFAMTYGGEQIGNALNAASGVFEIGSIISSFVSQQSLTMAGYDRRESDWILQRDSAGYDQAQIEAQIKENEFQQQISTQDLVIHVQNIKNNQEIEAYYKDKFTTEELYQWMAGQISNVYFQTYNLAFAMAKATERAYQYQFNTDKTFINYGYWDDLHKGLGAADGLMLALEQLDSSATLDVGSRKFEIEKSISLLQLNPKALIDLKEKGECIFEFNEKMFDYDFPGHYSRQIKTIGISIPAVVGPYQNINAILTQLSNQQVITAGSQGLAAVNYLLGGDVTKIPDSSILRNNWWTNQQIALSKGVNDSGLFELNFDDQRFLPFEGTGAVSTWRLSMPKSTNRIHFNAISDVVINLKYTARNGGQKFTDDVMKLSAFKPYSGIGYSNFKQMYPEAWYLFMNNFTDSVNQTFNYKLSDFVLPNIKKEKTSLVGFYIKIDAAVKAEGQYIRFNIADKVTVDVKIGINNDCMFCFKKEGLNEPKIGKVFGDRSLEFKFSDVPAALKNNDGFLNPDILNGVEVIYYYDGEVDNN